MTKCLVLIFVGTLCACQGMVDGDADLMVNDDETSTEKENEKETTENGEIVPAFEHERTDVRLLPFHVRMHKLSNVVGLPTTDPIFSELRNNRYTLGDHNYGANIGPDLNWNASKIALWVRSIQPLCASDAMAQRYPSLPDDIDALWEAAHLRPMTDEERGDITSIDVTNLSAAAQYETFCVAVLTSAEFVAQ